MNFNALFRVPSKGSLKGSFKGSLTSSCKCCVRTLKTLSPKQSPNGSLTSSCKCCFEIDTMWQSPVSLSLSLWHGRFRPDSPYISLLLTRGGGRVSI